MNEKATNLLGGKRRVGVFALGLLVIAVGLSWYISRSRESMPMYEGKPLTYWLECYAPLNRTETSVQQADHAIQAIGTNAVPTLVRLLQKRDSRLKIKLEAMLTNQSVIRVNWSPADYYHYQVFRAFWELGPDGHPAVPDLIKIYQGNTNEDFRLRILLLFGHMGPSAKNAVPFLASRISDRTDPRRFMNLMALTALNDIHSDMPSAIPALTNCLSDPNNDVRKMALEILTKYGRPIPILLKCLNDPSTEVRKTAVQALKWYGRDARPAVPALLALLHDKDPDVRETAYQALVQIDPKTASQYEFGPFHFEVDTNHANSVR